MRLLRSLAAPVSTACRLMWSMCWPSQNAFRNDGEPTSANERLHVQLISDNAVSRSLEVRSSFLRNS